MPAEYSPLCCAAASEKVGYYRHMARGKTPEKAFGTVLRQVRKEQHMSQETLAFESGFDRSFIGMLERGESSPTLRTIYRLAAALDCSVIDFFERMEKRDKRA